MVDTTISILNSYLDRYEIREKVGTGGMARVYRGYDRNLDREVAIKILHEHLAEDPMFKERFDREAKFVASITHPNIVQIYDYNRIEREDGPMFYMVMSYLPGKTLHQILESCSRGEMTLPRERILNIMLNLTDALNYAHEKGMTHRDVKPANIIIHEETDQAILTDFGIARMTQGSQFTQEGITVGTPAYMSPEQATGEAIDGRADIYALGVILYEMLTGKPPFEDDGSLSILLKHLNDPVPSISEQLNTDEPYFDAIIYRALAKSPDDRYQSACELGDDLKRVIKGGAPQRLINKTEYLGTLTTPRSLPAIGSARAEQPKRQTALWIATASLAVAIMVLLGFIVSQQALETATIPDEPFYFSTSFNPSDEVITSWPQGENSNISRLVSNDGYNILNQQYRTALPTVFSGGEYTNTVIQMRGRLNADSARNSAYGIIFRYVDDDNYYVFAVDGVGRYSVWARKDGQWIELRDPNASLQEQWTPDENVNRIGESNTLRVVVFDDEIAAYVNEVPILMIEDDSFARGRVGIYVASTEESNAGVVLDMFAVMNAPSAMTTTAESMTGGDTFSGPSDQ